MGERESQGINRRLFFEERVAYRIRKCKHFNGIQHGQCLAGVRYDKFAPGCLPCLPWPGDGPRIQQPEPCSKLEHPTREEAEATERAIDQRIGQRLADIRAGLCPHCRRPVERRRQVGPCIYAEPCGHRLGQGRLRRKA